MIQNLALFLILNYLPVKPKKRVRTFFALAFATKQTIPLILIIVRKFIHSAAPICSQESFVFDLPCCQELEEYVLPDNLEFSNNSILSPYQSQLNSTPKRSSSRKTVTSIDKNSQSVQACFDSEARDEEYDCGDTSNEDSDSENSEWKESESM